MIGRGQGARRAALPLAASLLAVLVVTDVGAVTPSAAATAGSSPTPTVRPSPLPDPPLIGMDPAVVAQLAAGRRQTEELLVAGASPDDVARALGGLGSLYLVYNLLEAADATLAEASRLAPEVFDWAYLLGHVRHQRGDLADAANAYRAALAIRPASLVARVRLGEVELDRGEVDAAASAFGRGLELDASCAACHLGLGKVAAARGEPAVAIGRFERALELQPGATALYYPLALARRESGDLDGARRALEHFAPGEVTLADPVLTRVRAMATGAAIHLARGRRALGRGDLETAVSELGVAVERDPSNTAGHQALGLALRRLGDLDAAIAAYGRAAELDPSSPAAHLDLGLALGDAGHWQRAEAHFRKASELAPDDADAYQGLGVAFARLGRPAEALEALDRALELAPAATAARRERGLVLARLGRFQEAVAELRRAVAADPDDISGRLNLGVLLERSGEADAAEATLEELLALDPPAATAARALLALGRIVERRRGPAAALEAYRRAARADAGFPPVHRRLGSALAAVADWAGAAAAYRRFLAAAPDQPAVRLALVGALLRDDREAEALSALAEPPGADARAAGPLGAALAYTEALLRAAATEPELRDAEAALAAARTAYGTAPTALHAQSVGLAHAAAGRWPEAVRAQERITVSIERQGPAVLLPGAARRLEAFRRQLPPTTPWRDDPALLYPAVLPLPAADEE